MSDDLVTGLKEMRSRIGGELKAEEQKLTSLRAQVGISEKRITDLRAAETNLDESIKTLDLTPATPAPSARLGKRIPIAWGHGTRSAYAILRQAERPTSVPELARMTLIASGVDDPNALQMKAMVNTLYRSINDQVTKGTIVKHDTHPATYSVA